MNFSPNELQKILVEANYIDKETFENAVSNAPDEKNIIEVLLETKNITKDMWGQAQAEYYSVPYADLNSNLPPAKQVLQIPEAVARKSRVVIFSDDGESVTLTTDDPVSLSANISSLEQYVKKPAKIAFSLTDDINKVLGYYREPLQARVDQIIEKSANTVPELLREIFSEARFQSASDIHIEPIIKADLVRIRLRIDGMLRELAKIPASLYENLLNRLKVLSNLRIDEHQRIQDGALRLRVDEVDLEIRVSIAPTVAGEKVTMRILSEYIHNLSLEALGVRESDRELLRESAKRPYGMIVLCGPTGSGKTTTAYTMLNEVIREEINITTIEDPVEYRMDKMNQIQVKADEGITFSKGLRSIVRQDPDVIFVGEIRDQETAEIAVNAALTGHLLFSTFHANSASATIPRLIDMEIEPFLLSSTLTTIVAQRLVRKLCESCRYSEDVSMSDLKKYFNKPQDYFDKKETTLYKASGCQNCNGTGYKGRTVIVEVLEVNDDVRQLIIEQATANQIEQSARKTGMRILFEDGIEKVKSGITSIDELLRVVEEPK